MRYHEDLGICRSYCILEYNDKPYENNDVVDLLNNYVEENEQLKQERDYFERKKCEYFNKYNQKHLEVLRLKEENEQLKKELKENTDFLIRSAKRLGFESLDHLLYTLDKGKIYGYSTKNWGR